MGCVCSRGGGDTPSFLGAALPGYAWNRERLAWELEEFRVEVEREATVLDESSPLVLRYRTPLFRGFARIRWPPVRAGEAWDVGWVQACTRMLFRNTYGDAGASSWELPQLRGGTCACVSDSDGAWYPFYGATSEVAQLRGPDARAETLRLSMADGFAPSVTWLAPVSGAAAAAAGRAGGGGEDGGGGGGAATAAGLTRVQREQDFTTWLVALNVRTKEVEVIRTVKWGVRVDIVVDTGRPLGQRATLLGNVHQARPAVVFTRDVVPPSALNPPSANDSQEFLWRPASGSPIVLIPARKQQKQQLSDGTGARPGQTAALHRNGTGDAPASQQQAAYAM
ncbi:protein FAM78B-like [Petromyzon marinus]|uniref:protein FAM78B-like n=1 Tax=Petromyzon marinus TaxID=7757 RepID=UPI003F6F2DCC